MEQENNNVSLEVKQEDPFEPFKKYIAQQISPLAGVTFEQVMDSVEQPKRTGVADLALNIPKLNKFKKLDGKPMDLAKSWSEKFQKNELVTDLSVEGTFLNFKIDKIPVFKQLVDKVLSEKEKYGCTNIGEGKTVIVEFSSPNIAKPFHAGHLRSTIIGNFLKQLNKAMGFKVHAMNYLGDWGKQYGLLAVGFTQNGSMELLEQNPIKHLFDIYVAINDKKREEEKLNPKVTTTDDEARAYFKRMEDGDKEALALWKKFRDLSIVEYKKMYHRLNVEFDEYSGESLFGDAMVKEIKKLEDQGLLEENNGAMVVNLKNEKLDLALVKKKDGATLYITRDIAAAHDRWERFHFQKMYYVVAAQQNHHFNQLFTILKKMGYDWANSCVHINFGMVQGMSTRAGNVVFLSDILEEAKSVILDQMKSNEKKFAEIENPEQVADIVGLSAVVIQDLSSRRIKDYPFQWERMTSFEGDTGPYLQYTHARLCSMERKAADQGILINPNANLSLLVEKEASEMFTVIGKYPSFVLQSYNVTEPCVVVNYLFTLCHAVSGALEKLRVLGSEKTVGEARLLLYHCARITIGNGIKLLGLVPLERM